MLSQIDFIIECRDYRVPMTSFNPLFEDSLAGRERMVVYTKKDLGCKGGAEDRKVNIFMVRIHSRCRELILYGMEQAHQLLQQWHHPSQVVFSDHRNPRDVRLILDLIKETHKSRGNLTGSHLMVVGMPNVGKSSLLNALRREGVGKGKAAHTGAQPGITRKIGTGVKIVEGEDGSGGVYLLDTPGVFRPYVPDAEAMLKLALCGNVKDNIVPAFNLADYLLFHINLHDPTAYHEYSSPTNDVMELLEAIARKTGRLQKGGTPDLESTSLWLVQRWRNGHLGKFTLDVVSEDALHSYKAAASVEGSSLNQARKANREAIRAKVQSRKSRTELDP